MKENEINNEKRTKLAQGLDYFTIRITIFLILLIGINSLGVNFYVSIIIASFTTAFINRQVNAFKQKRLTKLAKENSHLEQSNEKDLKVQEVPENKLVRNQPLSYLFTGVFLFGLGIFFEGWFRYYFITFSMLNIGLAFFTFYKYRRA